MNKIYEFRTRWKSVTVVCSVDRELCKRPMRQHKAVSAHWTRCMGLWPIGAKMEKKTHRLPHRRQFINSFRLILANRAGRKMHWRWTLDLNSRSSSLSAVHLSFNHPTKLFLFQRSIFFPQRTHTYNIQRKLFIVAIEFHVIWGK